jgi:hypothetical protein
LTQVLADPGIGGFDVTTVIDQPAQQIRLAIGFSAEGIDFHASDGEPVHLVASVVSPVQAAGDHLAVLARLATLLRARETLQSVRTMKDPREMVTLLRAEDDRYDRELAERRAAASRPRPPAVPGGAPGRAASGTGS